MYRWYLKPGLKKIPKGIGIDSEEKNPNDWALGHSMLMDQDDEDSVRRLPLRIVGLHEVISVYYYD